MTNLQESLYGAISYLLGNECACGGDWLDCDEEEEGCCDTVYLESMGMTCSKEAMVRLRDLMVITDYKY